MNNISDLEFTKQYVDYKHVSPQLNTLAKWFDDSVMSPIRLDEYTAHAQRQDNVTAQKAFDDMIERFLDYVPASKVADPRITEIYDSIGNSWQAQIDAGIELGSFYYPPGGFPDPNEDDFELNSYRESNPFTALSVGVVGEDEFAKATEGLDPDSEEYKEIERILFERAYDRNKIVYSPTRFFIDDTASRNRDLMYAEYSEEQRKAIDYDPNNIDKDSPLVFGTQLMIPFELVNKDVITQKGNNQVFPTPNFKTFYASYLTAMLGDINYKRVDRIKDQMLGGPITAFPNVSVIMWIRGLSPEVGQTGRAGLAGDLGPKKYDSIDELSGKWMDVTPFVKSVNTNVDSNGGSFQIEFSPILCEAYGDGWVLRPNTVSNYKKNDIINQQTTSVGGIHEIDQSKIGDFNPKGGTLKRNSLFFHHVIQPNDMVFIRYETMAMDYRDRQKTAEKFILNNDDIPNRPYDLIGLVDVCSENTSGATNDVTISVKGRDFTKAIIDDGSYFFATPAHDLTAAVNDADDGLVQRLTANGRYPILAEYSYRSIMDSMMFLMNCVSGIQVVPDSAFTGWGDRRVGKYTYDVTKWASLQQVDSFAQLSNKVKTDIFNQWFDNDERLLNLDKEKFLETFPDSEITTNGEAGDLLYDFAPKNNKGIWQIIRLQVDENIANRYLADSSIAYPDGSMISQFRKLCQEPYVEFYTDTYYDQFFFIVRQPPFTGKHIRSLLQKDLARNDIRAVLNKYGVDPTRDSGDPEASSGDGGKSNKKLKDKKRKKTIPKASPKPNVPKGIDGTVELGEVEYEAELDSDYIIKISDQEVISDNLSFDSSPVYSIYEYTPSNILLTNETFVLPLTQYAKVFGACRMAVPSQYVTYESTTQYNTDKSVNYSAKQIADDLVYLIESNAYLPFTRKGTIEIVGDRRIKRGMWIHYLPTDELYYVTAVRQQYLTGSSLERRTILEVERGMVRPWIDGQYIDVGGSSAYVSYFDIVNLDLIRETFYTYLTDPRRNNNFRELASANGVVNEAVFQFFLLRKQFRQLINTPI